MEIDKKYEQWKAITESDFVTLFIKTWFTFIAVLRELNPDVNPFDVNGMPRGDKPFLNAYKNNVMPIVQKELSPDIVEKELFNLYSPSLNKIVEVFPQYFFQTFFTINRDFNLRDKTIDINDDGTIKERYELSITIAAENKLRFYLGLSGKFRTTNYNEKIKREIDLRSIIKDVVAEYRFKTEVFDDSGFIHCIYSKILLKISEIIRYYLDNTLPKKNYNKTISNKIKGACLRAFSWINVKFEYNYKPPHQANILDDVNSYAVIMQQPFNGFSRSYDDNIFEQDKGYYNHIILTRGIEWFANYVYSLRNALFHEIIDPLDEEWQTIFKSAYLLLKQISDICISCVSDINEMVKDKDNVILNYALSNKDRIFEGLADDVEVLDFPKMSLEKHKIHEAKHIVSGTFTVKLKLQFGTDEEVKMGDVFIDVKDITYNYSAILDNVNTISKDENHNECIEINQL